MPIKIQLDVTLRAYRQAHPYFREASRRWRAGQSMERVYLAFPASMRSAFTANPSLFAALIDAIRANASSRLIPPSWAFPDRPIEAERLHDWVLANADPDMLPFAAGERHERRFERRQHAVEMRAHQRAALTSHGRPCVHEPKFNDALTCIACSRCGLVLQGHELSTALPDPLEAKLIANALRLAHQILGA